MYKILVVEDEYHMRQIIKTYFTEQGVEIVEAAQGYEALEQMNESIDLVLLDIMMPGIDGYEVCKQIRLKSNKPIVFISALSQEENQLMAYQIGADDFIIKPFKPSLLYAKVIAMIKRDQKKEEDILTIGQIQIDCINHILIIDHQEIILANREYELLEYMGLHVNQLLARQQILDAVWEYDYYGDGRAVDTYIKKLRKKLGKYACYIQTVIKTGYILRVVDVDEKDI